MRILNWTEQPDGWHAGPFHIEYLGRRLWVLSVRQRGRHEEGQAIVASGGSRGALMYEAGCYAERKVRTRRLLRRSVVLAVSVAAMVFGSVSSASLAPLATILGSTVAFVSAISILNSIAGRAFDHLSSHYQ